MKIHVRQEMRDNDDSLTQQWTQISPSKLLRINNLTNRLVCQGFSGGTGKNHWYPCASFRIEELDQNDTAMLVNVPQSTRL
jgi:hypothetical protein